MKYAKACTMSIIIMSYFVVRRGMRTFHASRFTSVILLRYYSMIAVPCIFDHGEYRIGISGNDIFPFQCIGGINNLS